MKCAGYTLIVFLLFCLSCGKQPEPTATHPKLIYIFTVDALRNDLIGLKHNGKLVLPNLSAFAKESVYFDNAYSQSSFTKISISSLFTGLWPSRLGVRHCILKIFPGGTELCRGLDFRFYTLAEYLSERGYDTFTALFTAHVRKGDGLLQGFNYQEKRLPQALPLTGKTFVYDHDIGLHAPYSPSDEALQYLEIARSSEVNPAQTDWYYRRLSENQGRSLYEYYLAEGYDLDRRFGDLLKRLQGSGSWRDALIVVTADHGEEFLEHGGTQHNPQLCNHVLRVPLFMKFPEGSTLSRHHGSRISNRVRLVDVFPTVVHLLRGQSPELDGESLIPIIENVERDTDRRPVLAFSSTTRDYDGDPMSFESRSLISGRWKAIWGYRFENSQLQPDFEYQRGDEIEELFDLEEDPHEKTNLVSRRGDVFRLLQQGYSRLSTSALGDDSGLGPDLSLPVRSEEERLEQEKQLKSLGYVQ